MVNMHIDEITSEAGATISAAMVVNGKWSISRTILFTIHNITRVLTTREQNHLQKLDKVSTFST